MVHRLLVKGGHVFDAVGDGVTQRDILVEDGKIAHVAPSIETDAATVDVTGKWVTPGFIDMHVHIWNLGAEIFPVLVGNGVTTVRDLGTNWTMETLGVGGDARRPRQYQLDIESGKLVGPNIIYSGPMLHEANPHVKANPAMMRSLQESSGDPGSKPLESAEEARAAVDHLIEEQGVGSIKIYESVGERIAGAIIDAVAGRVPVTGHLGLTSSKFAMRRGIGGMEHLHQSPIRDIAPAHHRINPSDWLGVPGYALTVLRTWAEVNLDGPEVEDWLRTLIDTKAFLDPTMTISSARPRPGDPRRRLFSQVMPREQQGVRMCARWPEMR